MLACVSLRNLQDMELAIELPKLNYTKDHIYDACQMGKQTRNSFIAKVIVSTSKPLQLFLMNLFGPTRTVSIGEKIYVFVIVDDFSHCTWAIFLDNKNDTLKSFEFFCEKVQRNRRYYIIL